MVSIHIFDTGSGRGAVRAAVQTKLAEPVFTANVYEGAVQERGWETLRVIDAFDRTDRAKGRALSSMAKQWAFNVLSQPYRR
jgi:hypothetical protein